MILVHILVLFFRFFFFAMAMSMIPSFFNVTSFEVSESSCLQRCVHSQVPAIYDVSVF